MELGLCKDNVGPVVQVTACCGCLELLLKRTIVLDFQLFIYQTNETSRKINSDVFSHFMCVIVESSHFVDGKFRDIYMSMFHFR